MFRMGSSSVSVIIFSHLILFLLSTNSLFVNPFFSLSVIVSLCASFNEDIRVVADPITASLSRCLSITTKRRTVSDSPGWMEKDWEKEGEQRGGSRWMGKGGKGGRTASSAPSAHPCLPHALGTQNQCTSQSCLAQPLPLT